MKRTILTALLLTVAVILVGVLLAERSADEGDDAPLPQNSPTPLPAPTPTVFLPQPGMDQAAIVKVMTEDGCRETNLAAYLPGVLAGEMPANFHEEALRAQAVAARTYILYKQLNGCAAHPEADVCNDPGCCKAWLSETELRVRWGENYDRYIEKMRAAVRDTEGLYLSYDGQPIQAVFHSSSPGRTENSGNIWGALPYLVSVDSPETAEAVPNFVSEVAVSAEEMRQQVLAVHPAADFSGEPEAWLGAVYYNDTGRVAYASIGGAAVSGGELREMFALRSACFSLRFQDDHFLFTVSGYGHGVGMSQYGANAMATEGAGYSEILAHYYPGTVLSRMGTAT